MDDERRTVEYTDKDGRRVYRTYRKPEPSYLKLHDETGQPWQVSITTDGELRTSKLDIDSEYSEFTFSSDNAARLIMECSAASR